jgi:DNA processing protein
VGARPRSPARGGIPFRGRRGVSTLTTNELRALLSLLYAPRIGFFKLRDVLSRYGDARNAWTAIGNLTPEVETRVARALEVLNALDVHVVTMHDPAFPFELHHVSAPPGALFARGRIELLSERIRLAVVGSRNCTEYGVENTRTFTRAAARAGVTIVSGLARGIDSIAHEAALEVGGDTISVLGNGIDLNYPPRNRALQERIAREGLLVTEFPPGTPALPFHFPHRNRIIAYLAKRVLVVEAERDSGSLSTAAHARESYDVLAVPGPLGRPTSVGTNELIRDGAQPALSIEHVLGELGVQAVVDAESKEPEPIDVDPEARRIWRALGSEPRHVDEVSAKCGLPSGVVTLGLLQLELSGRVRQLPGSRFVRG